MRWVAPIPSAADGTRNAPSTSADRPTIDFGLNRTALTAPSRMSPNCSGLSGTMPGLCAVSIGICGIGVHGWMGGPVGGGAVGGSPEYDWLRPGSRSCGPGAGKPPVTVICLPDRCLLYTSDAADE